MMPSMEELNKRQNETQERDLASAQKNFEALRRKANVESPDPHLERLHKFTSPEFDRPVYEDQKIGDVGIREDWDYRTAKIGPDNEPLPDGAQGWTKYGEPFFGGKDPLAEYWRSRFYRRTKDLSGETGKDYLKETMQPIAEDFVKTILPESMGGYEGKYSLSRFGEALVKSVSALFPLFSGQIPASLSGGEEEYDELAPINKALISTSRALGGGLVTVGLAMDDSGARPFKQFLSVVEGEEDYLGEEAFTGLGDDIGARMRKELGLVSNERLQGAANWVAGAFETINPLEWVVNTARVLKVMDKETWMDNTKMNWEAGRIMYSSWVEPALREEYKRRYLAGENPYLLELELENPIAEAAGEMIFDPWNFVGGTGFFNESIKASKVLGKVADGIDLSKVSSKIDDVSMNDLQKLVVQVGEVQKGITGEIQDAGKLKKVSGFIKMTSEGKRNYVQHLTSIIFSNDLKHVNGNPDKFVEIMRFRAMLGSADEAKRLEAIAGLMGAGLPIDSILSEGSLRLSKYLERTLLDGDDWNYTLLEKIGNAKDVEKLLDVFKNDFTKVVDDAFPRLRDVPGSNPVMRYLENAADGENLAGKVLGGAAKAGAQAFMNLSQSFPVRNAISNKFHIFADFGVSGLVDSFHWKDSYTFLNDFFDGSIPDYARMGYGSVGKYAGKIDLANIPKVTPKDWVVGGLKRSGIYEARARASLTATALKRSWKKNKRIVMQLDFLKNNGVSDDAIRIIESNLDNAYGDWDKALPRIMDSLKEDSDLIRSGVWVSNDARDTLRNYNVYDRFRKLLDQDLSRGKLIEKIKELREEIRSFANKIDDEIIAPDMNTLKGQELFDELKRFQKFSPSPERTALFNRSKLAAKNYETKIHESIMELQIQLNHLSKNSPNPIRIEDIVANSDPMKRNVFEKLLSGNFMGDPTAVGTFNHGRRAATDNYTYYVGKLRKKDAGQEIIDEVWEALKIAGDPPKGASPKDVAKFIYEYVWWPEQRLAYKNERAIMTAANIELQTMLLDAIAAAGGKVPENFSRMQNELVKAFEYSTMIDNAIFDGGKFVYVTDEVFDNYKSVAKLAFENGVPTAHMRDGKLINKDDHLLNIIRRYTGNEYEKLRDVPYEVAEEAFANRKLNKPFAGDVTKIPEVKTNKLNGVPAIYDAGGATISNSVPYAEAMPELERVFDDLIKAADSAYGRRANVVSDGIEEILGEYGKNVKRTAYQWRTTATDEARLLGNFALHDYGDKRNIDLVLSMIYPYQFWYSRSYANWAKRIANDPWILSQYVRYREAMEKQHAGLPDWYKYQLNTNELFGLDMENPMFINLESAVNPLNSIVDVDFNDPAKRVDWWTATLDGLGRFGPSINPILQYGTAAYLVAKGEEEAASHWGGRVLQITSTIQTIGAMTGLGAPELDPAVHIFSGGVDPWLRNRTGKALYQMMDEGWNGYTKEAMFDAARLQEGPIWEEAKLRAIRDRGWGQLASSFLGVAFKPRTMNDVEIEDAYQQFYRVLNMRQNYSPAEYKQAMNEFNRKYPYFDTVLTAKKAGPARDTAYAWSILGRIPPGDSSRVYEMVGLDQRIIDRFYEDKGNIDAWNESDKNRFIAAVVDISSVLAIPDTLTQFHWDVAKEQYSQMTESMKQEFGEDIFDKIDTFYAIKDTQGEQAAYSYLDRNPVVSAAMDRKTAIIVNGPEYLQAYYSGINKIDQYYKAKLYYEAQMRFGSDIFDISEGYGTAEDKKAYKAENPVLTEYWDFISSYDPIINERVISLYNKLPEGFPAKLREDFMESISGVGAQDLYSQLQQPEDPFAVMTPTEWVSTIGDEAYLLAIQAAKRELSYNERRILEKEADNLGLKVDRLVQYVGISQTNNVQVLQP